MSTACIRIPHEQPGLAPEGAVKRGPGPVSSTGIVLVVIIRIPRSRSCI